MKSFLEKSPRDYTIRDVKDMWNHDIMMITNHYTHWHQWKWLLMDSQHGWKFFKPFLLMRTILYFNFLMLVWNRYVINRIKFYYACFLSGVFPWEIK